MHSFIHFLVYFCICVCVHTCGGLALVLSFYYVGKGIKLRLSELIVLGSCGSSTKDHHPCMLSARVFISRRYQHAGATYSMQRQKWQMAVPKKSLQALLYTTKGISKSSMIFLSRIGLHK